MYDLRALSGLIEQYDRIIVLRHIHPDYDALGSQAGLASYLRHRYPAKQVSCAGREKSLDPEIVPDPEAVNAEAAQGALAIAVDTSTPERLDGREIWDQAAQRFLIDHHIHSESVDVLHSLIDVRASSCAEIIGMALRQLNESRPLDPETAAYLYLGLISDSIRYSINTTTARTLAIGAYLASSGLPINKLNNQAFSVSLDLYRFTNHLREIADYSCPGLAWCILERDDYESFGISASLAKTEVSAFSEIRGIRAWALFAQEADGSYSASLRSHSLSIREIAVSYQGGGHQCAAGIPKLSRKDCLEIIDQLKELVRQQ